MVAIRTVGKSVIEVGNDMIEGVVRLQSLPGPEDAAALREQLQQGFAVRLSIVPVEGGPHRVAA